MEYHRPERRHQHQRLEHFRPHVLSGTPRSPRPRPSRSRLPSPIPSSNVVSQTYDFAIPAGTGSATGGTTWNNSTLDPGLLQAGAPAFGSQNVSVVEYTGALETSINMPSYNPNIPGLSLNYDSLAANALPIIVAEHELTTGDGRSIASLRAIDL